MEECVDGEYQAFKVRGPEYIRKEFFGKYPELAALVAHMSDDELWNLNRGGHDPVKVYNAYKRAFETKGQPSVVLAKTIKGYGLGEAGEGRNVTHQQKKLNEEEMIRFRDRFQIPVPDAIVNTVSFHRPNSDSPEINYLQGRRAVLGGYVPSRKPRPAGMPAPALDSFKEALDGSAGRPASTTAAFVGILKAMLKDPVWGKFVVPIIPDEARTFGMESLFRTHGIYASGGQLYTPVDSDMFLYYKESKDGQILEEGITEAGSMASFTAAGTAYANLQVPMLPFYIYYSMFGYQRVGDQVWAFGDSRGKGFMLGGTAGRTTLLGEGLQHQDGHSPVLFGVVPNCLTYDPAYAFELAVVIQDGIRRMHEVGEDCFYYITVYNENYAQPPAPAGLETLRDGILKGLYQYRGPIGEGPVAAQLWGSGPMLNEALRAQEMLKEKYGLETAVWSATSYNELRREALAVERWNRLNPHQPERTPYVAQTMAGTAGPIIASSDYMKLHVDQLAPWLNGRLETLGTDGFGRSDNREHLRRHFEIDAESIVAAVLSRLARDGQFDANQAAAAIRELGLNPDSPDPFRA
jgi:pyruvate dehydrogenase E1 component